MQAIQLQGDLWGVMSFLRFTNDNIFLGQGQTSNFTRVESNANEQKLLFLLICIRIDLCEVQHLALALMQ